MENLSSINTPRAQNKPQASSAGLVLPQCKILARHDELAMRSNLAAENYAPMKAGRQRANVFAIRSCFDRLTVACAGGEATNSAFTYYGVGSYSRRLDLASAGAKNARNRLITSLLLRILY
jgi:hypothetical protein